MASNHSRVLKEEGPETIVSKASFPLTPADLSKLNYTEFSQYQSEKKQLDHCITMNLYELQQVYNRYATVGSTYALDYKPALVRMFLWQLWRDIGILDSDTSIHAIDLMLNENPDNGYETIHCPFEKIYFWQFLQVNSTLYYQFLVGLINSKMLVILTKISSAKISQGFDSFSLSFHIPFLLQCGLQYRYIWNF